MGGWGSGRGNSYSKKKTTESQHRIDIRWLKNHGCLKPGSIGSLSWSHRGEQTGSPGHRWGIFKWPSGLCKQFHVNL